MNSYKPTSLLPKGYYEKELHAHDVANGMWIDRLGKELQKIPSLFLPNLAPIEYLDHLAYATENDIYFLEQNLSEDEKRKLLGLWVLVHRKKGTIWAIEKMFEVLSIDAEVEEWFAYSGTPYRFKLKIKQDRSFDKRTILNFFYGIEKYKNVKSILDFLDISVEIVEKNSLKSSMVQIVPQNFYKKDIFEVDEIRSSTIQEIPKNFYQREVFEKDELKSSMVQEIPKNFYRKRIKTKTINKGVIFWQI